MAQPRIKRVLVKRVGTPVQHPEVAALLGPIVAFLSRSGIPDTQLSHEFNAALKGSLRSKNNIFIKRIGATTWCAEIVDRWLRDPVYLNVVGKPKDLPLVGKVSVGALIKTVGVRSTPTAAVRFLEEFGTVEKTSKGTYSLVKRYMNYTIPGTLPYEPNLEFLVDAVAAATRGLGKKRLESPLFWLRAQNETLSKRHVASFMAYVRQRGLVFLQEVDDWLEQHAETRSTTQISSRRLKRVGVGLFPICGDK